MKIFLYSINLFFIQVLGKFNVWLYPYKKRWTRGERLCYCEYEDGGEEIGMVSHISCCDCGASHYFWMANRGIYGVPVRPPEYKYRLRLPGETAFADEEAKGKWNERRYK